MKKPHATWLMAAALILAAMAVNALEDPADETKLAAALAQAREQRLADLHEYAEKGIFPHNHGHPGERVPYFMDRHGRLCAVGFLIAKSMAGAEWDYERFMAKKNIALTHSGMSIRRSGDKERKEKEREDEARYMKLLGFFNEIATTNNNIRINDVHRGPVLHWIQRSGLTQEEAALIQPGYSHLACDDCLAGSEAKSVTFGRQSEDSKSAEETDRFRIREHLRTVERTLREDSEKSLKICAARLSGGGPIRNWMLKLRDL